MLTCNKAGSGMVVDAASSNGPFQPVALLHIRDVMHLIKALLGLHLDPDTIVTVKRLETFGDLILMLYAGGCTLSCGTLGGIGITLLVTTVVLR
ncbi:hypothetical protein STEG23_017940, partial [Scotinomys teguina]